MLTHRHHGRDDHDQLVSALATWDAGGPVPGLHVGDVCWALRDPDEDWSLEGWWEGSTLVALALCEGPIARPRVAPDHLADRAVARAVADVVEDLPGEDVWSDARPGTALRDELVDRGWVDDGDPWACLYLGLDSWDPTPVRSEEAHTCVADRVGVQFAGFANSSFTEEKWRRMTGTAGYRPALDLVVRDEDGTATATGTAWLSVPGGTAIMEPVATHRDHRGAGHGTRIVHALTSACRDQGASGVNVWTPCSNEAAVATYRSAGFAVVAETSAVQLDRRG